LAAVAVSSAAMAQVTMYGIVDVGYGATESKTTRGAGSTLTPINAETSSTGAAGQQSGSRIGFRGTEEIGSLKAGFVYELGVTPTKSTGFADMGNRQAFASLGGNFGEVRIGRQYTGFFQVNAKYDVGGTNAAAGYLPSSTQLGATNFGSAIRADNVVSYTSPRVAGFQLGLSMAEDKTKSDNTNAATAPAITPEAIDTKSKGNTIGLSFDQGPISAMVAITKGSSSSLAVTGVDGGTTTAYRTAVAATDAGITRTNIGAWYDLGMAKVSLVHNMQDNDSKLATNRDTSYSDTTVGVSVPMGAITLFASTGTGSLKADNTVAGQTKGKLISYKAHQIGASYAMSKRTNVYAIMGEDQGTRKQTQATAVVGDKVKNTSSHVGIRHSF